MSGAIAVALVAFVPSGVAIYGRRGQSIVDVVGLIVVLSIMFLLSWPTLEQQREQDSIAVRLKRKRGKPRLQQPEVKTLDPITKSYVVESLEAFSERFELDGIGTLTRALSSDSSTFVRIRESLEIEDNEMHWTAVKTFHSDRTGQLLIPALNVKRGGLVDRLQVSSEGKFVSTLTFQEYVGAISLLLSTIFLSSRRGIEPDPNESHVLDELEVLVAGQGLLGDADYRRVSDLLDALAIPLNAEGREIHALFVNVVLYLRDNFLVIAMVPDCASKERIRLRVSWVGLGYNPNTILNHKLRTFCGLGIRELDIPLTSATETPSYHFQFECPKGSYFNFASAWITTFGLSQQLVSNAALPKGHYSFEPRVVDGNIEGRRIAHVYAHDLGPFKQILPDSGKVMLAFSYGYRERPPGSIAIYLLLSAYLALMAWVSALFYSHLFPTMHPVKAGIGFVSSSDLWATLMFGLPAVSAAWLASKLSSRKLEIMSLSSLVMVLWLLVNAVGMAVVSGLLFSGWNRTDISLGGHLFVHLAWITVMVSTTQQLSLTIMQLLTKSVRYWRRLKSLKEPQWA